MTAVTRAVVIPTTGPTRLIALAATDGIDATAFLDGLYAAIGCHSVECLNLTTAWDMWPDQTGQVDHRPINVRATLLAQSYGLPVHIYGHAVVTGTHDDTGHTVGLTDDQADAVVRRVTDLTEADPP